MSYFLFMDESGHDHSNAPYEVRGGIALDIQMLWPFVQEIKEKEISLFGGLLTNYNSELKGTKLLDKKRFKWAKQLPRMTEPERLRYTSSFLEKGLRKQTNFKRQEFAAYGQASIQFVKEVFLLLEKYEVKIMASCIPRGTRKPTNFQFESFLRKDQVFLLERYFNLLEEKQQPGILVLDETEQQEDRRFVKRLEDYFIKTKTGQERARKIVPSPFFVSSEMAYPIQIADIVIYCINWGFRGPGNMNAAVREEVADLTKEAIFRLQLHGSQTDEQSGGKHELFGIVCVPDPYEGRR